MDGFILRLVMEWNWHENAFHPDVRSARALRGMVAGRAEIQNPRVLP